MPAWSIAPAGTDHACGYEGDLFHQRRSPAISSLGVRAPRTAASSACRRILAESFFATSSGRHCDPMKLMPIGSLGAVETNEAVTFGLWLPWVSATDGNVVTVKIIHEADQFLQRIPARQFPLTHIVRPPYGDFWSGTVPIAGTASAVPGSVWGTPGRYVYRFTITNQSAGTLDWIIDPFAR